MGSMRAQAIGLILLFAPAAALAVGSDDPARFDGAWRTIVSCPAASDALGYAYDFPTTISNGVLHGEHGRAGSPGYLTLDGAVGPDGKAQLYASGLVGAAQFAVGQSPRGTNFGYRVAAQFDGAHGAGARIEGRPCNLVFDRR